MQSSSITLKEKHYQTAFLLAGITIVFNIFEGLFSIWLGVEDETLTLFGFGADSFIEVLSGVGIAHMLIRVKNNGNETTDDFENNALKITGVAFFILSLGLTVTAVLNVIADHRPTTTIWGVVISLISLATMWLLFKGKVRVGQALGSSAIVADANCTRVCMYMSWVLLISSAVYEFTHIAYVDVVGTAGIVWLSFKEGLECFEKVKSRSFDGCCADGASCEKEK